MRIPKIFSYLVFGLLLATLVSLWQRVEIPCSRVIQYSLGSFDDRFGMSKEEFLQNLETSEHLWEETAGKDLFSYSPEAAFRVNLVFDERQVQTIEAKELSDALAQTEDTQASLDQKQNDILLAYKKSGKEYDSMLTSFKKQLAAYNAAVTKWNKRGGAPEDEYEKLQDVARALEKKQKALEAKRQEVNELALQVNAFSEQKVAVVEGYNARVEEYTSRYGQSREFDQGDYVGTEINIYQFDDVPHLKAVMVHEFGHALGLAHGINPESIMYHLMDKQNLDPLQLSSEDKEMVLTQCTQTTLDIVFQRIEVLKSRFMVQQ